MSDLRLPLGVGLYSRAEAARLLAMHPQRINRWVRGYRYSWKFADETRRGKQPPVINTDLPRIDDTIVLSFVELMELRVVQEFIKQGIPLQTVRVAWEHACQAFKIKHPFADRRVFVDEGKIFIATDDLAVPDVLEISHRKHPFQLIAGPIFAQSLTELEFDERSFLARKWWPMGPAVPVVLDPRIAFGAPIVDGAGVRTATLALYARRNPIEQLASAYGIERKRVEAALAFESRLAKAA